MENLYEDIWREIIKHLAPNAIERAALPALAISRGIWAITGPIITEYRERWLAFIHMYGRYSRGIRSRYFMSKSICEHREKIWSLRNQFTVDAIGRMIIKHGELSLMCFINRPVEPKLIHAIPDQGRFIRHVCCIFYQIEELQTCQIEEMQLWQKSNSNNSIVFELWSSDTKIQTVKANYEKVGDIWIANPIFFFDYLPYKYTFYTQNFHIKCDIKFSILICLQDTTFYTHSLLNIALFSMSFNSKLKKPKKQQKWNSIIMSGGLTAIKFEQDD